MQLKNVFIKLQAGDMVFDFEYNAEVIYYKLIMVLNLHQLLLIDGFTIP